MIFLQFLTKILIFHEIIMVNTINGSVLLPRSLLKLATTIQYSLRASLQLNAHTRTCLGKFVIKLVCS